MKPLRGFQALYKNKANLFILLGLVFFVATAWIYTGLNKTRSYAKIGDVEFELTAFHYGEEIYSSVKILNKKAGDDAGPVKIDAEFFFINNNGKVEKIEKSSLIYKKDEQYLRTKCTDYDIIRVDVIVTAGGEEKEISTSVK